MNQSINQSTILPTYQLWIRRMPSMEYKPLDVPKDEIRLITLLLSRAGPGYKDKIYCSLENLLLKDYISPYNNFLSIASVVSSGQISRNALYAYLNTTWRLAQKALLAADGSTILEGLNLPSLSQFRWGYFVACYTHEMIYLS